MQKELVSVIIPTYNGTKWVCESVASILSQIYKNIEIVIVDDASTDNTVEILKEVAMNYPENFRIISLSDNVRAAAARNIGIKASRGEYIGFLDQDDLWFPDKLHEQVDYLNKFPNCCLVHSDISLMDAAGNLMSQSTINKENNYRRSIKYKKLRRNELITELFLRNSIRLVTVLFRHRCIEKIGMFDSTLFGGEEWEFYIRVANNFEIGYIPKQLAIRRIHRDNISSKFYETRLMSRIKLADRLIKENPILLKNRGRRLSELHSSAVIHLLRKGKYGQAIRAANRLLNIGQMTVHKMIILIIAAFGPLGRYVLYLKRKILFFKH